MNKKKILIFTLMSTLILASYFTYSYFSKPRGLTEVSGYNHVEDGEFSCLAIEPSCGYCPGTVLEKKCYVNIGELSDEEKGYLKL